MDVEEQMREARKRQGRRERKTDNIKGTNGRRRSKPYSLHKDQGRRSADRDGAKHRGAQKSSDAAHTAVLMPWGESEA